MTNRSKASGGDRALVGLHTSADDLFPNHDATIEVRNFTLTPRHYVRHDPSSNFSQRRTNVPHSNFSFSGSGARPQIALRFDSIYLGGEVVSWLITSEAARPPRLGGDIRFSTSVGEVSLGPRTAAAASPSACAASRLRGAPLGRSTRLRGLPLPLPAAPEALGAMMAATCHLLSPFLPSRLGLLLQKAVRPAPFVGSFPPVYISSRQTCS